MVLPFLYDERIHRYKARLAMGSTQRGSVTRELLFTMFISSVVAGAWSWHRVSSAMPAPVLGDKFLLASSCKRE